MEEPMRDGSMIIRAAARQVLISRETALGICKMVVANLYGEDECQRQSPLRIEDGGNVWTIFGAQSWRRARPQRSVGALRCRSRSSTAQSSRSLCSKA